jgi:signal transduction histidine kinase
MRWRDALRHPFAGYALAIAAAALTTVVMLAVRPFIHPFVSPPFLFVVLLVGRQLGFGPAVAAGSVSVAAFAFLFVTPEDPVITDEAEVAATIVLLVALVLAWVAATIPWSRAGWFSRLSRTDRRHGARAKEELLAIFAQDLRTSVAATRAALHEIETAGDPESAARARATILRQTDQLSRMAADLGDAHRAAAGRLVLRRRPLDLAEAVEHSVAIVTRTAARHRFTVEAQPLWVEADPLRLQGILVSLLDNAVKSTGPDGSIIVRVMPEGPAAILEVRDTGGGIARELLPRVFDGNGLAVVRRLVTLHGGTIDAESDGPGRGSRFVVTLPRVRRPAPEV